MFGNFRKMHTSAESDLATAMAAAEGPEFCAI